MPCVGIYTHTSPKLLLGQTGNLSGLFVGSIQDVTAYKTVLTPLQIAAFPHPPLDADAPVPDMKLEGVYYFNASADNVKTMNLFDNECMTLSLYFQPDRIKKMNVSSVVSDNDYSKYDRNIYLNDDGSICVRIWDSQASREIILTSQTRLTEKEWVHVIFTIDSIQPQLCSSLFQEIVFQQLGMTLKLKDAQ